jgi:hexulose-6-phosphate isomerase
MIKSISYWSLVGGWGDKLPPVAAIDAAKDYGFMAVELALGSGASLNMNTGINDAKKILKYSKEANVRISSLASVEFFKYNMASSDIKERKKAKEIIKKMLEIASWLEVNTLLVIPGIVENILYPEKEIVPYDQALERTFDTIDALKKDTENAKINIGIENVWNKFLLSPLEMRDFIDSFNSEFIGSYFDVGNVMLYGYPEHWIRMLGRRIKGVHFKDFNRKIGTIDGFCNLLEGDVNFKAVMKALRDIKYNSFLVSEVMPAESSVIEKTSVAFDEILQY